MRRLGSLTLALVSLATPAFADDTAAHRTDPAVDGAIIAGAVTAALVPMALRPRGHAMWDTQLLGELDTAVYDQFSRPAAQLSDLTLLAAIAAPAAYLTGTPVDDDAGDRLVIYGEALAVDLALAQVAKYVVHRPRPYLYNHSSEAARYAADAGDDGWHSFYSSHAAMSFGAAVAGAYLLAATNPDPYARAAAWITGLAVATATSNLRVRAGLHFYSDVVLGALVGSAVGYAVPALHASGKPYAVSRGDLAMAGVGILAGAAISEALPLGTAGHPDHPPAVMVDRVHVGPLALRDGGGLAVSGRVRSRWGRVPLSRRPADDAAR
ncbi:MAG TPA: phosphatase PAP2 family protein [Kofleriaceae bacterium]|jgi:membrane-associated phospholipid phosphatase|nr:phosphatase PAP2 family protein [Kofleriaceae bacterium]